MTARTLTPAAAFAVAAAGIGLFSIMDAFMKSLTLALGVYNALVWRTGLSAILGAGLWMASGRSRPSRRGLTLHASRSAITAVMALLFFWGLARTPMAQAISLSYIAPLLALLLGALFLGERVGGRIVGASLAALGGVAIIVTGQQQASAGPEALEGAAAILASAVLYAVNLVIARMQSRAARPAEIAFFQSDFVTLILLGAAPWLLAVPPSEQYWKIACGAVLASASLFLLGWAYAHGETGYLATTEYTSFIYAAVLGWAVFGEHVAWTTLAGAGVIVAACLFAARRRKAAAAAVQAAS